ncbi:hypothetical protein [Enterocloster sp.]|uniref:hypothetical protein n=1 Tax=Enterocloster sp. TaxID=2719315 RepID=UPI0039950CDF
MDKEIVFVIGPVCNPIVPKRHVSHYYIKKIVGESCFFKPHDRNACIGIEVPCNLAGNGIQFHTEHVCLRHIFRQHPQEVSCTTGWLQKVPGRKTHLS